jgi:hypothetical protein
MVAVKLADYHNPRTYLDAASCDAAGEVETLFTIAFSMMTSEQRIRFSLHRDVIAILEMGGVFDEKAA